jgi:hypothetical protein
VIAQGRRAESLPHAGFETLGLHQSRNPFAADRNALLEEVLENAWAPIGATAPLM